MFQPVAWAVHREAQQGRVEPISVRWASPAQPNLRSSLFVEYILVDEVLRGVDVFVVMQDLDVYMRAGGTAG